MAYMPNIQNSGLFGKSWLSCIYEKVTIFAVCNQAVLAVNDFRKQAKHAWRAKLGSDAGKNQIKQHIKNQSGQTSCHLQEDHLQMVVTALVDHYHYLLVLECLGT